ncbi:TonB-dependent receptor [Sphingobium sp. DC-2]|uniref:TonB-dependent receptor n=1 Tax=Sphingobium sp. DC-2 TaxID=1303256 RepID=UPI00068D290C|nr:TonB-dependent receptor [Sphingobium sp. DC-2]
MSKSKGDFAAGLLLGISCCCLAAPGWAQEAGNSEATAPPAGLDEIVVTAQRRSESLQRTALSVSAVNPEALSNAGVTTAANLTVAVPALQASNQGGYTVFFIRGIGSSAVNAYAEPAVAFNLNGVYITRPNAVNGQFFDVERVEVLKGPQGTLYGRNATGGAINLITRSADPGEFNGYLSAQYGNFDELLFEGALNVPMGNDGALRLAFQTEDHDGYYRDGTDDAKTRAFRATLRANLTPDLSVKIVGDYSKLGGKGGGGAVLPLGTTPVRGGLGDPAVTRLFQTALPNTTVFPGAVTPLPIDQAKLDTKTGGVLAEFNWNTGVGTITFLPAWRSTKADNFNISSGFWWIDRIKQEQQSYELRLASNPGSRFTYLLGGYYFKENSSFDLRPDNQFLGVPVQIGRLSTKSAAAFGQLGYSITDTLRLTGGARYTWEEKGMDGTFSNTLPAVLTSGPNLNPIILAYPPTPDIITNGRNSFDDITWKAGVEWDAGPQSLVYANVGTGFKAGGFFFSSRNNSYAPEKVTSFVAGTKNRFAGNRLQLNFEAYLTKYKDQQLAHLNYVVGSTGNPVLGFPTENVGRSEIYGAEIEGKYQPTPNTLFSLQAQYTHARYKDFRFTTPDISALAHLPPGSIPPTTGCPSTLSNGLYTIDCSGFALLQVPEWTISGSVRQTFQLANGAEITAEVSSRFEDERYASDTLLPQTLIGSNTRTDANLTYRPARGGWSVTAYINNIENDDVVGNIFVHPAYPLFNLVTATLRPPRTYGVRARVEF